MSAPHPTLVDCVARSRAVLERGALVRPQALYLMAIGTGLLPAHLDERCDVPLAGIDGVPAAWRSATLHAGRWGALSLWLLEDRCDEPCSDPSAPPWPRAIAGGLAARSGARSFVHVSAGSSCGTLARGSLALVRDHLALTASSPLVGLGESPLGPLFPDQTRVHHAGLRRAARLEAERLGLPAAEAVVACSAGPALETAAERRAWQRLGAEACVQGLAYPLHAAAHAGLTGLAMAFLVDEGEPCVPRLLSDAERARATLEDLLLALAPHVHGVSLELAAEARAT
jgi:purine-nucleoside phosphorylase